jgi:hypothetical protein
MSGKRIPEVESKFLAINSLREIIKKEKEEKDGRKDAEEFIQDLQGERESLGYNHLGVRFETGEELRVDNHTGCITLRAESTEDSILIEKDFVILNELSGKKIVKYGEILIE